MAAGTRVRKRPMRGGELRVNALLPKRDDSGLGQGGDSGGGDE